MKKLKIFMLVFFVSPIVVGLFSIPFSYGKQLSATAKPNKLEILNNHGETVGYLVGSVHLGFSEAELSGIKETFNQVLPEVKNVYIEATTGHWSQLAIGTERTLLEAIETSYPHLQVKELESFSSQQALIYSIFYIGSNQYTIPYGPLLYYTPVLCQIFNVVHQAVWLLPNLAYQTVINPSFQENLIKQNTKMLENIRKDFLNGETGEPDAEVLANFRIVQRDQRMFSTLLEKQTGFSKDNKFLMVVGSAHLAADEGILSHFEKSGYTYQPMLSSK